MQKTMGYSGLEFNMLHLKFEDVKNLLEGCAKGRLHSRLPGHWSIYPNPEKARGLITGFCMKEKRKDAYVWWFVGSLLLPGEKEAVSCSTYFRGNDGFIGDPRLPEEQALVLKDLLKKATYLKDRSDLDKLWPVYFK